MPRHKTFASISGNKDIQNALRDLYDHPDKVELYPGAFCEGDGSMGLDPGPKESNSALWTAIFSDAITLVRSDRFYTVVSTPELNPAREEYAESSGLEHQFPHLMGYERSVS